MRFRWKRHLMVTAFAALSALPFVGCSSQQQQASDEVVAEEGQQGVEEGGEETAQQTQGGGDETVAQEDTTGNPTAQDAVAGEDIATNAAEPALENSGNGDLKEIISEMNGSQNAPANAAIAEEAAAPAEAAPTEEVAEAVPANQSAAAPAEAAPAPAPASTTVGGLPEMGSKMAYVVAPGDTLAKIATKIYGDAKRWRDIAGLSGMENPNHIYPGDLVYYSLDEQSQTFAQSYENVRRGQEVVREGDTLATIAKRVYGSSKMWKHVWRQNDNIDNPDKLSAGMTIYYIEKSGIQSAVNTLKGLQKEIAKKISKFGMDQTVSVSPKLKTMTPLLEAV